MKIRITVILAIWLGFCLQVSAQVKNTDLLKEANIFFAKNTGELVLVKDSADYIRVIRPDTTDKYLFQVNDFYLNGKPKMIGSSLSPRFDLKRQGTFIEYFPNGHRKSIENYDDGWLTGGMSYYYPNGRLYYTANYDRDKKEMIVNKAQDTAGAVIAENGNGKWIEYDEDFKHITAVGPINNGLKEGEWRGNPNDSVAYLCTYSKGVSISGVSRTKSGREYHFTKDIVAPEFKGGMEKFYAFLQKNVHYPAVAKQNNIQGKVFTSFYIEADGHLSNLKIVRSLGSGCDDEVIRVLKLSPPWSPEYDYGIAQRVRYTMPMSFTLQVEDVYLKN